MNDNGYSIGACPAKYQGKLFLNPTDIMNILGISENSCYRYLHEAPFRVEKIGKLLRVNAKSFWTWYNRDWGRGNIVPPNLGSF